MKALDGAAIGSRIRKLREERGLSRNAWAKMLGMTAAQVTNYEQGRIPDPGQLQRIRDVTGVTVDWLLTGSEEKTDVPRQAAMLAREAPGVYESLIDDLRGDRRLLQAVQDLITVLKGQDQQAADWLLGNITVFAERARGQSRKRKGREAG